uniref:ADAM metallopeptidase with thrombospondin type 1 motif, 9 n=1 Tax=Gasterosteus aculeatus aculeatus TaxID=481459 RepID=A0AAQ4S610_GASAC
MRKRRSLDESTGNTAEHWASPAVHYRISAFGEHYHLNLTLDSGFIAPLYTVTVLGAARGDNLRHCFYKGLVNAQAEHAAVISLCSGLVSFYARLDTSWEYFVEPLHSFQGEHYEEEHTKPHIVYRKRASTKQTTSLSAGLATNALLRSESASSRPANDSSGDSGPHRRSKRFLSYPRFVEVMLVADSKMVEHHGSNLQHYILTLMSIVSSIYKDPSVGNLINIVIVKLVIINHESDGPDISFNAQITLKNFCIWQQSQNILDDNHQSHHDTAILITRRTLCCCCCKGLAELGTVCDPYRSCSISEDNGLSTAFTIAHELGHVFNMPHDDSNKCKEDGVKIQQHVMAPTLNYNTNPWMWSKCSRKYITEFLDTGYGECLLDEPVSRPHSLSQPLPGQIYDVNKQCELIFGQGTQVCPYMTQCRRLWCTSPEGAQRGCRTQHMPWADGTDCSPGKHCKHGLCIAKEHDATPVEGAWGVWSPFGTCSRTCGGGIKMAVRECNRPVPRNGGMYCVGRRMKFRSCNSEPCSKQKKDFREEQCAAFDGRHFNINGLPPNVRWVPKYSGILMKDRCKLFCRVAGSTAYYQLRDRVTDGTPCGPDTNDICVQGLCRQAGCDHVLNSKARRDKCGVCGGDNSSCKTVAGTFNIVHYGYNDVVRIPSGATNIDVRQHSYSGKPEDDNYLAISNNREGFLLNGEFVVSMFKREIKVGNVVIEYSGSDHVIERINCTDQILLVCVCMSSRLVIKSIISPIWDLFTPISVRHLYDTAHSPLCVQQCSSTCAGGFQRRVVVCQDENGYPANSCEDRSRPNEQRSCESGPCPQWIYGNWGECTKPCGGGIKTRLVVCQRPNGERFNDLSCEIHDKPPDREQCNTQPCPSSPNWSTDPWSSVRS